jgi:hypothetical protein
VNQVPPIPEASKCQPFRVQEPTPPRSRNLGGVGKLHGARGMELPAVARLRSLAPLSRCGSSRGRPKASCVHPSGQSPETSEDAASAAPQLSGFEPLPSTPRNPKPPRSVNLGGVGKLHGARGIRTPKPFRALAFEASAIPFCQRSRTAALRQSSVHICRSVDRQMWKQRRPTLRLLGLNPRFKPVRKPGKAAIAAH